MNDKEKQFLVLATKLFEDMAECGMKSRKWQMADKWEIVLRDRKKHARSVKK